MIAQAGLGGAVGGVLAPLVFVWIVAAGVLCLLILFGLFVTCIRAWNRWSE